MNDQLMNLIQAKLMMSDSSGKDNTIRNIVMLQILDWMKTAVPSLYQSFYNRYISKFVQEQKNKLEITQNIKSKIKLVKNYLDEKSSNEFNKIDGVMYYITRLLNLHSLTYNGMYFYFNFYDEISIEQNIFFKLKRVQLDKDMCAVERIEFEIFSRTKNIQYIRNFIDQCHTKYNDIRKNTLGDDLYYFDMRVSEFSNNNNVVQFTKNKFHTNKNFNNIFFKNKDEFDKRMNIFLNDHDWYFRNGISHTLGLLLHGHPGCGKTSLIKATANETKRHIINVNMKLLKNNNQLKQLFYSDYIHVYNEQTTQVEQLYVPIYKRVFVFEDFDCMENDIVLKRDFDQPSQPVEITQPSNMSTEIAAYNQDSFGQYETTQNFLQSVETNPLVEKDPITLSSLLNVLDGNLETPNRIIIMTTNHPEVIDDALIRPGRVDLKIHFTYATRDMIVEMFENFYKTSFPMDYYNRLEDEKMSPATIIQILFRNIHNFENAIEEIIEEQSKVSKCS